MLGFTTVQQEVNSPAAQFELKMLPIEQIQSEIVRMSPPQPPPSATPAPAASPANARQAAGQPRQQASGFQRTEVNADKRQFQCGAE